MSSSPKSLKVGVLLALPVQLLDLSPVDLFGMLEKSYLQSCQCPPFVVDQGVEKVSIHYIGPSQSSSDNTGTMFQYTTANAALRMTDTVSSPAVKPGELDILMIPGPSPDSVVEQEVRDFVKGHADNEGTDVLTICTGAYIAAQSGIWDGKTGSGPRPLIPALREKFPSVKKWDDERRWVVDGNLWSSGGITNGQEMTAAYIKSKYPGPVAHTVCAMADVGERGEFYPTT